MQLFRLRSYNGNRALRRSLTVHRSFKILCFILVLLLLLAFSTNLYSNHSVSYEVAEKTAIKRFNMGKCKPIYGKVSVFVAMRSSEVGRRYTVAQDSLRCYLKGTNYTLFYVDLSNDPEVRRYCTHENVFFRKHCAASVYLSKTDWMLVLDADTAVVNPNHCIEEYIDPRVDLVFYERFFNWEITAGNYLVKNTDFARRFLRQWADYEYNLPDGGFHGYDNGAIHIHVLRTVLPKAVDETEACQTLWANASDYDTYLAYVTCVKFMLGAVRVFPPMLRILKRGHGMARDGVLTNEEFCEADFMLHGYKQNSLDERDWESPFEVKNKLLGKFLKARMF
uniref:Hexosyltransferase n=1 Tax=Bursaphelenchus xylophilus TaxID=6326 RepID=A0A1I7SE62_BURXY